MKFIIHKNKYLLWQNFICTRSLHPNHQTFIFVQFFLKYAPAHCGHNISFACAGKCVVIFHVFLYMVLLAFKWGRKWNLIAKMCWTLKADISSANIFPLSPLQLIITFLLQTGGTCLFSIPESIETYWFHPCLILANNVASSSLCFCSVFSA